ncbi:hypothetical protein HZB94_05020 [Candidatus Falkowbacteria bacterium]|nr:hypothetical protein [Candidatus Falkowbacteria bacterium]
MKTISVDQAVALLGRRKVVSKQAVNFVWDRGRREIEVLAHYSPETLAKCAEENTLIHGWFFIYYQGLTLLEQYSILNERMCFASRLRFYPPSLDVLQKAMQAGRTKPRTGYYLLDLMPSIGSVKIDEALAKIREKKNIRLCPMAIFSEAIISVYAILDGVRIAENWYHASMDRTDDKRKIIAIGRNDWNGIDINSIKPACSGVDEVSYVECLRWEQ